MAKRSRQQLGNVPVTMICVNAVTETTISGCFGEGALADSVPLRTASGEFYNGGFAEKLPFTGFYDLVMKLDPEKIPNLQHVSPESPSGALSCARPGNRARRRGSRK